MPRPNSGELELVRPATALMASAVRMPGSTSRVFHKPAHWQGEAWRYYDTCGELRYATNWIGNVISRATLHAGRRTPEGQIERVSRGRTATAVNELFGGAEGQAAMLDAFAVHLTVAGECYLVGRAPHPERGEPAGKETIWEVVGTQEIKKSGDNWSIDYGDGRPPLKLAAEDVIIRIWRPHPRKRIEADSPVRAVMGVLQELEFLSRHIMAQVTSRLAGGGLLLLPQGMTFPSSPDLPADATDADKVMAILGDAMLTPIKDPGDPSALVPVIMTAPDDTIEKVKHIKFWTDLDQHAVELRSEAIRRLALGLDMPPEVLLGTADVNHWGGWQIEESSIKAHIEPLLELITGSLSTGYIQPLTNNPADVMAYDTQALRLRPNRSREAIELYDRGELSSKAMIRETGFSDEDMPDEAEFKRWLLRRVAGGSTTPEQVAEALNALGVSEVTNVGSMITQGPPRVRSLDQHPDTGMPPEPMPNEQPPSLAAACEVLVYRTLERAGNRLRSLKQTRPACSAADTYQYLQTEPGELDRVLEDAWSCIPRVLKDLSWEKQQVVENALDTYCRDLLLSRREHSRDDMIRALTMTPVRRLEKP